MTRLNQKNTPTFGSGEGWQKGVIAKILNTKAVLGEFQPHKRMDGKRVPDGEPIKKYFPAVIDEDLYYRALGARLQRRTHSAGRKGTNIANLFSGLAHCAYCNGVMRFENKGSAKKNGGTYLCCERARRGLGCEKTRWRYDDFENSFIAFVKELNLDSVFHDNNDFIDAENEIAALRGQLASKQEEQERTFSLFASSGKAVDFVGKKLSEQAAQIELLETTIKEKEKSLATAKAEASEFRRGKAEIKELNTHQIKSYVERAQVAARIKSLISTIVIAPAGYKPTKEKIDIDIRELLSQQPNDAAAALSFELARRYFCLKFKDGTIEAAFPRYDDPLRIDHGIWLFSRERNFGGWAVSVVV